MHSFSKLKKAVLKYRFEILVVIISTFFLSFFHFKGFNPQDEGWILYGALRMFHGEIPYQDFQFLYTPASLYLTNISFNLFGPSILSERIFSLSISLISIILLLAISRRLKSSKILTVFAISFYIFWGPAQTNFLWPVMLILPIFFASNLLVDIFLKSKKHEAKFIVAFGILTTLGILTKQNYGAVLLIFFLICILFHKKNIVKNLFIYFLSAGLTFIPQYFYLLHTNSLLPFYHEMYDFLFTQAIGGQNFHYSLPWDWPAPIYVKLTKIFFYLSPLALFIFSLMLFIKNKTKFWQFPLLAILFYLAGIKIVIDFTHQTPILAYSSVLILVLTPLLKKSLKKDFLGIILIFLFIGIYTSYFKNYYKYYTPLSQNNYFWNNSKTKIWISESDAKYAESISNYINTNSQNEYFYSYGNYPIYYFLSNTKNPTKFATIETRTVTGENLNIYIKELKQNKPKLIMSDGPFTGITPVIENFIMDNYSTSSAIGEKIFLKRNIEDLNKN